MALTLDNLASIVANAKFDELVGEVEGQFFDVKSQPYNFVDGLDGKREFAKDVAAFANALGGYILIGFTTTITSTSLGEQVAEIHPVPATLFNIDQHNKLIQEWLYPQPAGVQISFVPFGQDSKGILVAFVPPQSERSKPFLLTKTLTDKKSTEVLLAYVERKLDFNEPHSVVELHHAIRIGLNVEQELLGRFDNLETLITKHFAGAQEAENATQTLTRLRNRVARLLEEGGQ